MAYYIQRKEGKTLKTVGEFETLKEALEVVKEYCLSDPSVLYYISHHPSKYWTED